MEHLTSNIFSHFTAKERDTLSFPAKYLLNQGLIVGETLDFGCGFGKDAELLAKKGISIDVYDKHYFPKYPTKKYDSILCFYVLNVVLPEEQATILMEISRLLKPSGRAFFAVRRDIKFEGFRTHKIHQKPTYQCNVRLPYHSIFTNESCEIYEYQHFNQLPKSRNLNCPFCDLEPTRDLIVETATAFSFYDKFPVSSGHALIVPKRHCSNYFELTFKEQSACWYMVNKVKQIITESLNPSGFNVGININKTAGQSVEHAHIHLIPRYTGDVEEPRGGIRSVIPSKQNY